MNENRATKGYHRFYQYGLRPDDIQRMLASQDGGCEICRTPLHGDKDTCVDHDHESGRVRGLLCHSCNIGLGKFRDDLALVRVAVEYLARYAAV